MSTEETDTELSAVRTHQLAALGAAQLLALVTGDLVRIIAGMSPGLSLESTNLLRSDLLSLAANATRIGTALEESQPDEPHEEMSMQ